MALNNLTKKEWTKLSVSVWRGLSPSRKKYKLEHGATFPEPLVERIVKIYTKKGDLVLDPFVGVGTTLIESRKLERFSIGIELYEHFVKITKNLLVQQTVLSFGNNKLLPEMPKVAYDDGMCALVCDDCRNLLDYIKPNSVQLVLTSPPYSYLMHVTKEDRLLIQKKSKFSSVKNRFVPYGDDPRDFGNLTYEEFVKEIEELMKKLYKVTKPGGYGVWVVRDFRDTKRNKPYIPLHVDIARAGEKAGFVWHDLVVWDQNDNRKLVLLGYPSVFYTNINHTFLIVLRKRK